MTKLLLPLFVGVFLGAFVVELLRRNSPEVAEALIAKAKRVAPAVPRRLRASHVGIRRRMTRLIWKGGA